MTFWLFRLIKRLAVLVWGLLLVYLALWKFFPFFDNRVPVALALFVTYVFTAYFFIPVIIRGFRLIYEPKHIPLYCVTPDGFASDPINIGIIGTKKQITKAMKKAGWFEADKKTLKTTFKLIYTIILRKPYPNAPFSTLFLFGRKQDLGFQMPIQNSSSNRHHVRFWACHTDGPEAFHADVRFWQRFHRPKHVNDNRQLWVGAASKDTGIIPIKHNAQLTHMIDPDTNSERELIVETLRSSHSVQKTKTIKVGAAYVLRNRALGGFLKSDGKMRICILKD